MTKTIRFFKISEGPERDWFADVSTHTLAENDMVAGCDLFLEVADMLTGRDGEVRIAVSDNNPSGRFFARLDRKERDLLGEHPETIYLHNIN
jgi:hypothetical protein